MMFVLILREHSVYLGSMSFCCFCMMKPRAGNIHRFCSKLSQSNLKGPVKIPCEHKCHTKYRSGSGSGHERPQKVTRFKNSFSGMRHTIYSHVCAWNSKIEAVLQSDSMQVNDREWSGQPRVTKVKYSIFSNKNVFVWTTLNSRFLKMPCLFLCHVKNAENCSLKKWVSSIWIRFLGYMFAKNG